MSVQPFYIEWIQTYSNENNLKVEKGFFRKLSDFVTGRKDLFFSKPVNILAYDTSRMFVLDQGICDIIYYNYNNRSLELMGNELNLPSLVGIAEWTDGRTLVTDSKNGKVYIINPESSETKLLNDSLDLFQPTGIAYNKSTDEIIIAETSKHRLAILNREGDLVKYIGTRGKDSLQFNFPTYMCYDDNNRLYLVDAMNFRIQVFDSNFNIVSIFGQQGDASGYIASPKGIAVDSYGHIYLVDALFHTVQIFDISGNYLYSFGIQGKNDGQFLMPMGICIDRSNRIYVADSYNSRIQVFQLLEDF